jgi:hypothetical protein
MKLSIKKFEEIAAKTGADKCHLFSYTRDTKDCCSMHDNLEIYLPCEVLNGGKCEFYEAEKRKIQAIEKLEKLETENEEWKKANACILTTLNVIAEGNKKLRQTLTEIKEMIPPPKGAKLHLVFEEILKKISEVEDGNKILR